MKTGINYIGIFAQQVLERSKGALVSGISSRGIYLQPEDDWTLYLSLEEFRGPLTLNLEGFSSLENIKAGYSTLFNSGEIHFPDQKITISLGSCDIWHPPKVDNKIEFYPERIVSVLSLAKNMAHGNPYLPLLSEIPGQLPGMPGFAEKTLIFQNALNTGRLEKLTEGSAKLLGLGPGLTPLGDDFLLGVLLTLNRWGHLLSPDLRNKQKGDSASSPSIFINNLNQIILENARLKTTHLSASLLACAAEGAADERLLKVLDVLFTGPDITENEMDNLLHWGSSSGIAVLAGMISVLKNEGYGFL